MFRKTWMISFLHVLKVQKLIYHNFPSVCSRFELTQKDFFSSYSFKIKMNSIISKPPNVLVYTGEDFNNGDPTTYRNIYKNINLCLHPDCYTMYLLTPLQVMKDPWQENLECLVISCDNLSEEIASCFRKYLMNGGKVLNFGCKFTIPGMSYEEHSSSSRVICVEYKGLETWLYSCTNGISHLEDGSVLLKDVDGNIRIVKATFGKGTVIISGIHLEMDSNNINCDKQTLEILDAHNDVRLNILIDLFCTYFGLNCQEEKYKFDLTPCYLLTLNDFARSFINNCSSPSLKRMNLKFLDNSEVTPIPAITEKELPILYNSSETEYSNLFDKDLYFSHLDTKSLGQMLFFIDVVGTTMSVIQSLPHIKGAVVCANVQVQGKGRRGNRWITPRGAIALSTYFSFPLQSPLGQKLSIIQYFAVLSFVKAFRETPGYEDINIQVKWPNDIYFNQTKIGGVIVNSTVESSIVHVYIGSGLNLDNKKPTLCLNEIIRQHNSETGKSLPTFSQEELIAKSLNELELLVQNYQENNADYFFNSYYKYWMHSMQKVILTGIKEPVTIIGIDQYGFLLVETEEKKRITLQPDGNSFDIMKNLIIVREL